MHTRVIFKFKFYLFSSSFIITFKNRQGSCYSLTNYFRSTQRAGNFPHANTHSWNGIIMGTGTNHWNNPVFRQEKTPLVFSDSTTVHRNWVKTNHLLKAVLCQTACSEEVWSELGFWESEVNMSECSADTSLCLRNTH